MNSLDPVTLIVVLALAALLPTLAIMTTSFLKIGVVLSLLRNALGVQQVPPNMALYGLAVILTAYVMAPVATQIGTEVSAVINPASASSSYDSRSAMGVPNQGTQNQTDDSLNLIRLENLPKLIGAVQKGIEPLRGFMLRIAKPANRDFFMRTATRLWGPELAAKVKDTDFVILVPAFVVSELTSAFQVGFLLFLPFVIIDLIVSNVLLAMGMMMVSPITISLPLKLFLFVMVDGWTRLIQGLVLSYT